MTINKFIQIIIVFQIFIFQGNLHGQNLIDSNISITDTIPSYNILAQLNYPEVTIYTKRESDCDYCVYMQLSFGNQHKDTMIFGSNMTHIYSISIDTIHLNRNKYPEVVLKWIAEGSHQYGPQNGGWQMQTNTVEIWDINDIERIYSADTYKYNFEFSHTPDMNDSIEQLFWESFKMEDYLSTYTCRLKINTEKQIIIIDSIYLVNKNRNRIRTDKKKGVYKYKGGKFVWDWKRNLSYQQLFKKCLY